MLHTVTMAKVQLNIICQNTDGQDGRMGSHGMYGGFSGNRGQE